MSEETPKLTKCPFCGGEAAVYQCKGKGKMFYYVQCACCYSRSGVKEEPANAVSSWNNRSGEDK